MKERILEELKEIEEKQNVKIIYACLLYTSSAWKVLLRYI